VIGRSKLESANGKPAQTARVAVRSTASGVNVARAKEKFVQRQGAEIIEAASHCSWRATWPVLPGPYAERKSRSLLLLDSQFGLDKKLGGSLYLPYSGERELPPSSRGEWRPRNYVNYDARAQLIKIIRGSYKGETMNLRTVIVTCTMLISGLVGPSAFAEKGFVQFLSMIDENGRVVRVYMRIVVDPKTVTSFSPPDFFRDVSNGRVTITKIEPDAAWFLGPGASPEKCSAMTPKLCVLAIQHELSVLKLSSRPPNASEVQNCRRFHPSPSC
jgi:hypothetical protein